MTSPQRRSVTVRVGESVRISGPSRVVVQSIPDQRVVLAVEVEPGIDVLREPREAEGGDE